MKRWSAWVDRTARAGSFLGGLAVLVITLLVTYDVAMRYFLGRPQVFVHELASFLLVLVIFWGLAHTFRSDGHIAVDLVTRTLRPPLRASLRAVTLLLGLAFLAIVTWETWETALRAYRFGRVSTVMLYPLWIPQLCIPLGLGLMFFAMLVALIRRVELLAKRKWPEAGAGSPD
jgi:TRAP-type C4-dicarboxylate transport system permease small subunit